MVLPDFVPAFLAQSLGPLPRSVSSLHVPVSSRRASASQQGLRARHTKRSRTASFAGGQISGLQTFRYVQAPVLARPSGCPHLAVLCLTKRQGLIHHAAIVRLPNTNCGIATYPNRVIDTAGPSPAGMQSCRLLKPTNNPLLPSAHYQSRRGLRLTGFHHLLLSLRRYNL